MTTPARLRRWIVALKQNDDSPIAIEVVEAPSPPAALGMTQSFDGLFPREARDELPLAPEALTDWAFFNYEIHVSIKELL